MKPIAAETEREMPVIDMTRSKKIVRMDSGTTRESRFMARCWFSNSPDQTMSYPIGSFKSFETAACSSATTEPMSRS